MPPRPRLALRLAATHGLLAFLIVLLVGGFLLAQDRWRRDRQDLLDESIPRFSDMLAISRLGDVLAETAGTLATARDRAERTRAVASMAEARAALAARLSDLNGTRLEPATRERLRAALTDMGAALDSLDGLVSRRFDLRDATARATARLAILGDLLPDLERDLLAGRTPEGLPAFLLLRDPVKPAGPSGGRQAAAIRGWARNAQVAVGMMLAATGAASPSDLEYLSLRADESLRRAASAIRRSGRSVIPLLEALQAELTALAVGAEGRDGVVRLSQQRLGVEQNTPAVLVRGRQASDRLTAAVAQVIADLEQTQAVRRAGLEREALLWRGGAVTVVAVGLGVTLFGLWQVWRALVVRLRALVRATRAAGDATPLALPPGADRTDELGALIRAVAALDAERRRVDRARHDGDVQGRLLLAATPVALVLLGGDGRVEGLNAAAQRLFGQDEAALLGRALEALFDEDTTARLRRRLDHACDSRTSDTRMSDTGTSDTGTSDTGTSNTGGEGGDPAPLAGLGRHADGRRLPLALSLVAAPRPDGLAVVLVAQPREVAPPEPGPPALAKADDDRDPTRSSATTHDAS